MGNDRPFFEQMQKATILAVSMVAVGLSVSAGRMSAQSPDDDGTRGTKIIFHVTSVSQQDDPDSCPTGGCSATKFTVEGYADVQHDSHLTKYVLKCSEILASTPSPHFAVTCGRVHANSDYAATRFADTINFEGGKPKPKDAPPEALYVIVSEKEVDKPHK